MDISLSLGPSKLTLSCHSYHDKMTVKFSFWLMVAAATLGSSCVTNKKFQYLQKDDVNVSAGEFPKDSLMRQYKLPDFEYRIQREDLLSVQVYSLTEPEFDFFSMKRMGGGQAAMMNAGGNSGNSQLFGYLVDEGGHIEFPVVGKVNVAGLTIFQAQEMIKEIAENYLKNPTVEVRLLNFRFTLLGAVEQEGVFVSQNNRITFPEAIGLANGFSDLADKSNIKLIRTVGGKAQVYYLNLLKEDFVTSPFFYVNQNDIIIVPPLRQRPFQTYFGRNMAIFISSLSLILLVINLYKN